MKRILKVYISYYSTHHNHFIYASLFWAKRNNCKVIIERYPWSMGLRGDCLKMEFNNELYFFDYNDSPLFSENPLDYKLYFKRSLLKGNTFKNVIPLGFQINLTYSSLLLLKSVSRDLLFDQKSRIEFIRSLDFFKITNYSHFSRRYHIVDSLKKEKYDHSIIYLTRLWSPHSTNDKEESHRREEQNYFRINAVNTIRKNIKNSIAGIYPDDYSKLKAPELLVDKKVQKTENYFKLLCTSALALADDGLKNTPGWKIGEYAWFNRAIITTPIEIEVPGFNVNENYLSLKDRFDFNSIPDVVDSIFYDESKLQLMQMNNKVYAQQYLSPYNYFENIIQSVLLA